MEKTTLAYVLPVEFGWDDLGDWNAIERLLKKEVIFDFSLISPAHLLTCSPTFLARGSKLETVKL
ncbi:hypothetical protein I8748_18485 [Nostoc sp. CENA67]|uniref:Mannose-1-phosphate guanylyltransferase n=2 Tax=Amazonocrinis TaxID=2840440 RepID=A0A8J7HU16_9NOST|nr:hypothetical protein [Amazonocrinis nigriterrae CENA67]